ncbi:DUF2357 domain-containing protein [Psychrobacter alimentarius]|uniref:DUF2357 domain-containing protein n=1 Tax=Psychrobacter alimentarius TaxID=261164 RepID=UPI003FD37CBA
MIKKLLRLIVIDSDIVFSIYPNGVRRFDQDLTITLKDNTIYGIPDNKLSEGIPPLVYDVNSDIFQKVQLRDNTEYEFTIDLPLTEDEFLCGYEANPIFPFSNTKLKKIIKLNGPDSCLELRNGHYRITGRFNFENNAGTAYFNIDIGKGISISLAVEVLTQKLDYYEEFQQLLHQISEYNASLLIRFDNVTETIFGVSNNSDFSSMSELLAFRRIFQNRRLTNFIHEIINNPSSKTLSIITKEKTAFVTNPDWGTLSQSVHDYNFMQGGVLQDIFSGYTPITLPERRVEKSYDTKDNRFIKSILSILKERLERLKYKLPNRYEASHSAIKNWIEEINTLLFHPFWTKIGVCNEFPNSMVMFNRKGYRELVMSYLTFGLRLKLGTDNALLSIGGDIKPVFNLYEMWCYLMIHSLLCEITNSTGDSELSFTYKDQGFIEDLISNNDKPIIFTYTYEGKQAFLKLFYNKDFNSLNDKSIQWADSYSGVFHPDISIAIEVQGILHWLHFDAKYRLNTFKLKSELLDNSAAHSFKRNDIHKMHTYRDALLGTRGSYILYPGSEENHEVYVRNPVKAYRDNNIMPSVGAFPLKPTESDLQDLQMNSIKVHLKRCIQRLLNSDLKYIEEFGFKRLSPQYENLKNSLFFKCS